MLAIKYLILLEKVTYIFWKIT